MLTAFISRGLRDAIDGSFVDVRVNEDANASLGRICQRLLVVLAVWSFLAHRRCNVFLFFDRWAWLVIDRYDYRFHGNGAISGRQVFV